MKFAKELFAPVYAEGLELFKTHWEEIAHFKDIPLQPDYERYIKLEELGVLHIFTARADETGELLGYAFFTVNKNLHYASSLQAHQDIIYVRPEFRGTGGALVRYCDEELGRMGVEAIYHHVKVAHNFGSMLEKHGYKAVDVIYGKRL